MLNATRIIKIAKLLIEEESEFEQKNFLSPIARRGWFLRPAANCLAGA